MFEFIKKDDMIYSVKGFWEVKKNTYGKIHLGKLDLGLDVKFFSIL